MCNAMSDNLHTGNNLYRVCMWEYFMIKKNAICISVDGQLVSQNKNVLLLAK